MTADTIPACPECDRADVCSRVGDPFWPPSYLASKEEPDP